MIRITPIYKPWKGHLEGEQPYLGAWLLTTYKSWDDPPSTCELLNFCRLVFSVGEFGTSEGNHDWRHCGFPKLAQNKIRERTRLICCAWNREYTNTYWLNASDRFSLVRGTLDFAGGVSHFNTHRPIGSMYGIFTYMKGEQWLHSRGKGKINIPHMSHEKNPPTFHYTGWLIGILIVAYYNPYITG